MLPSLVAVLSLLRCGGRCGMSCGSEVGRPGIWTTSRMTLGMSIWPLMSAFVPPARRARSAITRWACLPGYDLVRPRGCSAAT